MRKKALEIGAIISTDIFISGTRKFLFLKFFFPKTRVVSRARERFLRSDKLVFYWRLHGLCVNEKILNEKIWVIFVCFTDFVVNLLMGGFKRKELDLGFGEDRVCSYIKKAPFRGVVVLFHESAIHPLSI